MARNRNKEWYCGDDYHNPGAKIHYDQAQLAVLMDIRDELQALNRVMQCHNVQRGFRAMERMDRRLAQEVKLKAGRGRA